MNEELTENKIENIDNYSSEPKKENNPKEKRKTELMEWIKDIVIACVAAFLILQVIMPTVVKEHSMDNTLQENDYLFVYKLAYKFGNEPERGDIIIFQSDLPMPNGIGSKVLVKRIIAVAGDKIEITDGKVFINDVLQNESYIKDGYTSEEVEPTVIPEGKLFCMGDNRLVSLDSRNPSVGLVDTSNVIGKVVFRLFPLKTAGKIE